MSTYDHNIIFCNLIWKETQKDVKRYVSKEIQKEDWHYIASGSGYRDAEFQIPSIGFYQHGSAYCASDAKNNGWNAYLRHINVEGY